MKDINLKNKKIYIFYISFIMIFFTISCKNDDDIGRKCSCEAETTYTIPNKEFEEVYGIPPEEQMSGFLFYKHPEVVDGFADHVEEFKNKFWIFQGTKGCWNCRRNFIVCNEDLIGEQYDYLKQQGVYDSIPIQFSGDVKIDDECVEPFIAPADINYATIKLILVTN